MTDEELFILLVHQLGVPQELISKTQAIHKGMITHEEPRIDYLVQFVAICGVAGRVLKDERDLRDTHNKFTKWYFVNNNQEIK